MGENADNAGPDPKELRRIEANRPRSPAVADPTPASKADEFHLALTETVHETLETHLFPQPDHFMYGEPERGAIGVIVPSTGCRRTTYILRKIVEPEEGDVWFNGVGVMFSAEYRDRATSETSLTAGGGLIYFHTHPGMSARPSGNDKRADAPELFAAGKHLGSAAPLATAIIAENERRDTGECEWSVRAYEFNIPSTPEEIRTPEFSPESAVITNATAVRIVGERLRKLPTIASASGPRGATGSINEEAQDSAIEFWSETQQQKFAGLRIGVPGCGGVGSWHAELLPRHGLGEAVFADFDRVKHANRNRMVGTTQEDAANRVRKIDVAERVAERAATAPEFNVRTVFGSVVEHENADWRAVPELLDCDVIINAADSHRARRVLDDLSRAHCIPVIDGGTQLRTDATTATLTDEAESVVGVAGPEHPCLECMGRWYQGNKEQGVVAEQLPPDQRGAGDLEYVQEGGEQKERGAYEGGRAPAVMAYNGFVASLQIQRLIAMLLGISAESALIGSQRYRPRTGTMDFESHAGSKLTECRHSCDREDATSTGDHYELGTGIDRNFRAELEEHEAFLNYQFEQDTEEQQDTKEDDDPGLLTRLRNRIQSIVVE